MVGSRFLILGVIASLLAKSRASNVFQLQAEIDEEQKAGTVVADMADIFNLRWEERAGRRFELFSIQQLQQTHNVKNLVRNLAEVNPLNGIIKLSEKLDRDELCGKNEVCVLKIQAVMQPQRHFRLLKLNINIRDINDNAPLFPFDVITINVSENALINDVINLNQYRAQDLDAGNNSVVDYSLSSNQYFIIHSSTDAAGSSQLRLVLTKELDFERQPSFQFKLTATDRGFPTKSGHVTLQVNVIDVNDNKPIFDQSRYVVSAWEDLEPGTEIAKVHANDLDRGTDAQISYKMILKPSRNQDSLIKKLLTIDAISGAIYLQGRLDFKTHNGLNFLVEAADSGSPPLTARVRVTIHVKDVNDNPPIIKQNVIIPVNQNTGYLPESAPLGTYVAYVGASDDDDGANKEVELNIRSTSFNNNGEIGRDFNHFLLAPDGFIQTEQSFDRELEDQYFIEITACDKGNLPRCSNSSLTIKLLDQNDHSPIFTQTNYHVTVPESKPIGSDIIKVVASDNDRLNGPAKMMNQMEEIVPSSNGVVRYRLAKHGHVFSIDRDTGQVMLVRPLDREQQSWWEITVIAQDGGLPPRNATSKLVVNVEDVNDNQPLFISPATNNSVVYASTKLHQPVINVQVIDYDGIAHSDVTLDLIIIGNEFCRLFVLDKSTNKIYLNHSFEDEKLLGEHYVVIEAVDNGSPPLRSRIGLYIRVTDDLTLLDKEKLTESNSMNIYIIILPLACAILLFFLVIVLIACIKRKIENRKPASYTCNSKAGDSDENQSGDLLSSKQDCVQSETRYDTTTHQTEPRLAETLPTSSNQSSVNRYSLTRASVPGVPPGDTQPPSAPQLHHVTCSSDKAATNSGSFRSHKLPPSNREYSSLSRVTSSQLDKDSGRGDSEVDSSCWHAGHERKTILHCEITDTNNLSRNCTVDCERYGHSDSCWMPDAVAPIADLHLNSTKPELDPIRENPSLCMAKLVNLSCAPSNMRPMRMSLRLALNESQEKHHHHPFRSEPLYPFHQAEDIAQLRQLWTRDVNSPYSSVFESNCPSPSSSNDQCSSPECDRKRAPSERQALLQKQHYMSLVGDGTRRNSPDTDE